MSGFILCGTKLVRVSVRYGTKLVSVSVCYSTNLVLLNISGNCVNLAHDRIRKSHELPSRILFFLLAGDYSMRVRTSATMISTSNKGNPYASF